MERLSLRNCTVTKWPAKFKTHCKSNHYDVDNFFGTILLKKSQRVSNRTTTSALLYQCIVKISTRPGIKWIDAVI